MRQEIRIFSAWDPEFPVRFLHSWTASAICLECQASIIMPSVCHSFKKIHKNTSQAHNGNPEVNSVSSTHYCVTLFNAHFIIISHSFEIGGKIQVSSSRASHGITWGSYVALSWWQGWLEDMTWGGSPPSIYSLGSSTWSLQQDFSADQVKPASLSTILHWSKQPEPSVHLNMRG